MRKIIPYIIAIVAALNLIWLFAFDYKIPDFINNTFDKMFHSAAAEDAAPAEEENGEEQQTAEGAAEQGTQEAGQEAAGAEPGMPAVTETGIVQEETVPETAERTCQPTEGTAPNIRSGPGSNYDVIGAANNEDIMVVRGDAEGGWLPIRTKDGLEGYVFADLVRVIEPGE